MTKLRFEPEFSEQDKINLEKYGCTHPNELDPNTDIDVENGQCCCGEYNCKESYAHWSSGF